MGNTFAKVGGITVAVITVLLLLLLSPMILLWSLNTLLEQAGNSTYIPHNFWTYLAIYGIMLIMKSSNIQRKAN